MRFSRPPICAPTFNYQISTYLKYTFLGHVSNPSRAPSSKILIAWCGWVKYRRLILSS